MVSFQFQLKKTITISVKADIRAGSQTQTIGLQIATTDDVVSSAKTVKGVYPLSSNIITIANLPLAEASFAGAVRPAATQIDPGKDILAWEDSLNIITRDVYLKRIAFRVIGTINRTDLKNLRLLIDGKEVAKAETLETTDFVTFVPGNYKLTPGNRVFRVLVDVVGGSTRNFSFQLRNVGDIELSDSNLNVNIRPTVNRNRFTSLNSGVQQVRQGILSIQLAKDSPAGNIVNGGTGIVMAKYILTAAGEPIKVETLRVGVNYGPRQAAPANNNAAAVLRNARLMVDGVQVGNTVNLTGNTEFDGVNFTINPEKSVTLEIKADVFDSDGTGAIEAGDTIAINLLIANNGAQALTSSTWLNVPVNNIQANTLRVVVGGLTLARTTTYLNQTIVVPRTAYKLADFILRANDEDVELNNFAVTFTAGVGAWTVDRLREVYIKYGDKTTDKRVTVTATTEWTIGAYTLPRNTNLTIEVYADIDREAFIAGDPQDTMRTDLTVRGMSVNSRQVVNTAAIQGQTMTAAQGTLNVRFVGGDSPQTMLMSANSTKEIGVFEFRAQNDTYIINSLTFNVENENARTVIQTVNLKDFDNKTLIKTEMLFNGVVTYNDLNIAVESNKTKKLIVEVKLGPLPENRAGADVRITLTGGRVRNSQQAEENLTLPAEAERRTANIYVYRGVPVISNVNLPAGATTLSAGENRIIARIKIEKKGENIGWRRIIFNINKSNTFTVSNVILRRDGETAALAEGNNVVLSAGLANIATTTNGTITVTIPNEEEIGTTERIYVLTANLTGNIVAGNTLGTNIARPTGAYTAPVVLANVSAAASFVWTDRSALNHADTTADWNSDFRVDGLPTESQTLRAPAN